MGCVGRGVGVFICPRNRHSTLSTRDSAMTTPPSPAAQAVWDAWNDAYEAQGPLEDMGQPLGAALRAAANQAHPKAHIENIAYTHQNYVDGWKDALDVILGISDELEGQP